MAQTLTGQLLTSDFARKLPGLPERKPYPTAKYVCWNCGGKAPKPEPDEMPLCDACAAKGTR